MKRSIIITSLTVAMMAQVGTVKAYKSPDGKSGGSGSDKALAAGCLNPESSAVLELNNVRTTIYSGGDMWWDLKQFARYEVPKGSGKHSLYLGTLWIGGTDVNGQLKVAAQRYRANGPDYYTGPLDTSGTAEIDAATCKEFDKIWKMSRAEAALHRFCKIPANATNINCQGYQTPESIKNWPAITYKQNDLIGGLPSVQYFYAPFIDVDGDMAYDPESGDYPGYDLDNVVDCQTDRTPYLYGDLTLYWIFNDKGNIHYETQSTPIGMEVRAQAFSFATNDEVNNMTFYNYELINRGTTTLFNCYFGVNTDADLGYAFDDYAGCDVLRGFGYIYNGDAFDAQGGNAAPDQYGANPPAVGIDFFEGPYADPNNQADAFDANDVSTWLAINGVGYDDPIVDNERIGMRRFVYYSNASGPTGDPDEGKAIQYYNYLRGYWKNSSRMVFGGSGFPGSNGATTMEADFMFPGDSDPYNWGTQGADPGFEWTQQNPCPACPQAAAADQRFVQSAGPFTLLPGAVNDITTGAVWARAFTGDPFESVNLVRKADDKAQQLFENCFRLLNGPDAPDVYIQELDRELIVYWTNNQLSNNYLNRYEEFDYSIDTSVATTPESRTYKFEGYLVYQVTGPTVTSDQRHDLSKARLIAQADIKNFEGTGTANPIGTLINYTPDQMLGYNVPQVEVQGANAGIIQSLKVTEDAFATGADKRLVNHKNYYFLVIAYGYNNYKKYDQNDPLSLDGQKKPFISSRKSSTGAISIYAGIPHITASESNGTILNSFYGDGPEITRIEGSGNGGNNIDLTVESENTILAPPYYMEQPVYQRGRGPIHIKVIDPLSLEKGTYYLAINGGIVPGSFKTMDVTSRWAVLDENMDTVAVSDADIQVGSEQILFDATGKFTGLSVTVKQVGQPGENRETNNGFIESTMEIANPSNVYMGFIPDDDVTRALNWILAGNQTLEAPVDYTNLDPDQVYERIAIGTGGSLAPYRLASYTKDAPAWAGTIPPSVTRMDYIQSVDLVLTPDKSKWTRVPVLETDSFENFTYTHPDLSTVKPRKMDLRRSPSVDKNGRYATDDGSITGDLLGSASNNPEDANYISEWGMGWFPGYAISVETGERLNMAFGEDSYLAVANGRDMLFNPTGIDPNSPDFNSIISQFGDAILGGKHFIYIFGSNEQFGNSFVATPRYDEGAWAMSILKLNNGRPADADKRQFFRAGMWTGIPLALTGRGWLSEDLRVRMRVTKPYAQFNTYQNQPVAAPLNDNKPLYKFSLDGIAPTVGDVSTARSAMDLINAVPNPYYAYSGYETNQLDNRIKITNLPPECTITIYNTAGSFIRRFTKSDNRITSVDWDLKNYANIPVSSGIYIIHVKAPGLGERIIKWFGVLRPTDVSDF